MTSYQSPHPTITGEGFKGRDHHPYHADGDLIAAANAAYVLQMPLLLTGEAGCGKTDFAFALAAAISDQPLKEAYVRSDSVARDLLYHYDALRRFGDAHHGGDEGAARAADPRHYIELKALGRALVSPHFSVVLIDEIDKAPRDLPNDLLRELDQGQFDIPEIRESEGKRRTSQGNTDKDEADQETLAIKVDDPLTYRSTMSRPRDTRKPFVVITSNVERQLPDPFLRRCVFFHIRFPTEDELLAIVRSWFPKTDPPLLEHAVAVFGALRATPNMTKKPATSELISWVRVLYELYALPESNHVLNQAHAALSNKERIAWDTLPGLPCLVKLREDRERLGIGA